MCEDYESYNYIGNNNAKPAKNWRICHVTIDSDGSIVIPIILATKLINCGYDENLVFLGILHIVVMILMIYFRVY